MVTSNNSIRSQMWSQPLIYRGQSTPAIHGPGGVATPVILRPHDDGHNHTRHAGQLATGAIANLNAINGLIIDATEYCKCYEVDPEIRAHSMALNGEPVFQQYVYLFSVVIAFEWLPSPATIQRIQIATKKASDVLYDATDGFMAIGQVLVGGPDLLDVADIQVMASNRFHPRSWISALHEPPKFQPIRLGRGLWRKDQGFVVPWDEADAHRVLVHEWGHYALELVDEYLDFVRLRRSDPLQRYWAEESIENPYQHVANKRVKHLDELQDSLDLYVVAPSIALPIDSIMATLASSELVPRRDADQNQRWQDTLARIQRHFPLVRPQEQLEGPAELPIPDLPVYARSLPVAHPEEGWLSPACLLELQDFLKPRNDPDFELAGSSWVYAIKVNPARPEEPGSIIGQGVLNDRDLHQGFDLLGVRVGDSVVVVTQVQHTPTKTAWSKVIQGTLTRIDSDGNLTVNWANVTPPSGMLPDFIDVLPELSLGIAPLPTQLRVQIETQGQLPEVWVGALGNMPKKLDTDTRQNAPSSSSVIYPDGKARTRWVSERGSFDHLDGHILLRWNDRGEQKLFICGYSHGGGPCTGGGGYCVCYTAGSYEGNSMIFFRDNYDSADTRKPLPTAQKFSDAGMRIVSTVMHKGPQFLESASNDVFEARSYIFSFGSSQKLSEHSATLVLYYDERARKQNGDLLVYRWGGSAGWQRLTTYAPENRPYVCIPLDEATPETSSNSPSIIGRSNEYVDRYRIYWTPRA